MQISMPSKAQMVYPVPGKGVSGVIFQPSGKKNIMHSAGKDACIHVGGEGWGENFGTIVQLFEDRMWEQMFYILAVLLSCLWQDYIIYQWPLYASNRLAQSCGTSVHYRSSSYH